MIILLCGKIGCGKSRYAQKLREENKYAVLSSDELLLKVFTGCLGSKHDETAARCLDYLYGLAVQLDSLGVSCVIDDGHWTAASRNRAKAFFKSRGLPVSLRYIEVGEERRMAQIEKRNRETAGCENCETRVFRPDKETVLRLDTKFESPAAWEYDEKVSDF